MIGLLLCTTILSILVAFIVLFHFTLYGTISSPWHNQYPTQDSDGNDNYIFINISLFGINHGYRSIRLYSLVHKTTKKHWR